MQRPTLIVLVGSSETWNIAWMYSGRNTNAASINGSDVVARWHFSLHSTYRGLVVGWSQLSRVWLLVPYRLVPSSHFIQTLSLRPQVPELSEPTMVLAIASERMSMATSWLAPLAISKGATLGRETTGISALASTRSPTLSICSLWLLVYLSS